MLRLVVHMQKLGQTVFVTNVNYTGVHMNRSPEHFFEQTWAQPFRFHNKQTNQTLMTKGLDQH